MFYYHSRGANSVNSINAILQRGCISLHTSVVQLFSLILTFQNLILAPLNNQQQPRSLFTDKKERIQLRSKQTLQVGSHAGYYSHMWFSYFLLYSFLFLVEDETPRKYRPILMQTVFPAALQVLVFCWVSLVPATELQLLWQCAVLKALSVLPRGWALLGRKEELQCWSSWLKKYFS